MRITDSIQASLLVMAVSAANLCLAEDYSKSIEIPDSGWRVETQCSTAAKTTQCVISVSDGSIEEKVLDYPGAPTSASY